MDGGLDNKTGRITIFVTTDALCQIVKEGSSILMGDENIVLKVTSILSDRQCEASVVKAAKPLGEHCQVEPLSRNCLLSASSMADTLCM